MEKMIYRTLPTIMSKLDVRDMWMDILDSGVLTMGKYTSTLESEFAKYVGSDRGAVAVNSCATALYVALRSMSPIGKGERKKVIVPTNTFLATANAVIIAGYEPVFCDVDATHMCMDYKSMVDAIELVGDENVFAVIPVHMAGYITPDMQQMCEYCRDNGILVIEDCAHAFGSVRDGVHAGMFGDVGCFSLFATKTITSGEGGIIVSRHNHAIYNSRVLCNHGMVKRNSLADPCLDGGVTAEMPSLNFRMTEMAAALGLSQLRYADLILMTRTEVAKRYSESLSGILELPPSDHDYPYWHYIVKIKEGDAHRRDDVCIELYKNYGIQTANIYKPACHEQDIYKRYVIAGQKFGGYHTAMDRLFSIPIHCSLTYNDVTKVIESLSTILTDKK